MLRREARVAGGALTGVGDTAIPTFTAAIQGGTGAGPVTLRASRIAPIDLDPKSGIADSSRLPGLGAGCWAWQEHAACKGMDSSRFFPPERERASTAAARIAGAKKICADCPVLVECRAFALRVREPYGVWVGSPSRTAKRSADCSRTPKHTPMLTPAHTARSPHAGPVQSPDQERGRADLVLFTVGRSR